MSVHLYALNVGRFFNLPIISFFFIKLHTNVRHLNGILWNELSTQTLKKYMTSTIGTQLLEQLTDIPRNI